MTDQFVDDPRGNALKAIALVDTHCERCNDFHLASLVRRAALSPKLRVGDQAVFIDALKAQLVEHARGTKRPLRVTIAGSTDTWLYTAVLNAALEAGGKKLAQEIVVDLVDQCATPLVLCSAFAEEADLYIRTHQGDIKNYVPPKPVDLIVMHGVLPFFPEHEQIDYLNHMRSWLSARGKIICSNQHGNARGAEELESRIDFTIDSLNRLLDEAGNISTKRRTILEGRVRTALQRRHRFKTVFSDEAEARERLRTADLRLDSFQVHANKAGSGPASRYAARVIFTCSRLA
ncbi:MAG: class I SAM-dependent methyltransferase [Pseudomonadota bacterium]